MATRGMAMVDSRDTVAMADTETTTTLATTDMGRGVMITVSMSLKSLILVV